MSGLGAEDADIPPLASELFVFVFFFFYLYFLYSLNEGEYWKMDELPGEVLLLMMSFCGAAELAALAATSCSLARLALDDPLWRRLFATRFFEPPPPPAPQYLPPSALSTHCISTTAQKNKEEEEEQDEKEEEEEKEPATSSWASFLSQQQPKLPDWWVHQKPPPLPREWFTCTPAWASAGRDWTGRADGAAG